ncbi:peptidase S8/S53 domain-containing protein [Mycena polygramma]|nr:peptidase S8/S53 domain-containing protein [Mycena polygramma]
MRTNPLFCKCLSFLSLALVVYAGPQLSPYLVHEKRTDVPDGWAHSHKVEGSSILPLRIGLTQPNIESIDQFINDVAHPDSPSYGKHWTPAEVAAKFAPTEESIEAVREWLIASGIDAGRIKVATTKSWIRVNTTVEEAENLLKAEYHMYEHQTGKKHIACDSYQLPGDVQAHIDLITPTVHFNAIIGSEAPQELQKRKGHKKPKNPGLPGGGVFRGPKSNGVTTLVSTNLSHCDTQITPACLRALYGLNNVVPRAASKNSYGIVEYTPQAYVASDIDHFASAYAPDLVGKRPVLKSIDGGVVQTTQTGFGINGESNLDLQYGMALVTGAQPVKLYQVGDTVEGASFNDFLDALDGSYRTYAGGDDPSQDAVYPDPFAGGYRGKKACGTTKPSNVISVSYAYNEADLTPFYTHRQCNEYAKLGLMGVTVLYSSGDNGVAGNGGLCLNPNGTQSTGGTRFNPSFPGTCPYITSVGATQVLPNHTVLDPEVACQSVIHSGGGFSNYFALPSYQKTAVQSYLKSHPPPYTAAQYNTTASRGFPDLSANGANYVVSVDGSFNLVYGTSASTPVVGAILTLVNDARIHAGKGPIGFINPTIYSSKFASAFHDITSGSNPGCGTNGFSAAKGWDPVTGLGTPNFPMLASLWLALP